MSKYYVTIIIIIIIIIIIKIRKIIVTTVRAQLLLLYFPGVDFSNDCLLFPFMAATQFLSRNSTPTHIKYFNANECARFKFTAGSLPPRVLVLTAWTNFFSESYKPSGRS